MSERDYFEVSRTGQIRNWIMSEMLRGGGYAAVVLVGIGLIIGVIYLVGLLLPAESRNTPPPMPFSQLEAPLDGAETRLG
ncbi:RC-LH1 core complex protein PufX [Rhodobacteraceae bacterium 2376]|uniref:RC-LH1 core complex protein PufX n=1 Tax=Rhabdonatronobacter sediminivivens TaxID=2743469 RepID=A0A7Z0KYR6_9RHOB|nr:RC-LH1 core complex protein PufX [Rhabdonatronobacter sediminivivens]NYS25624.1 RC-LH1 core complex protein PufX [Rhabdonatronobacter sediminivivens]